MNEMDYTPAVIEVKRGEQIHFVLRNVGTEAHEFLLATTAENLKHGEAMKKNPDMEHDEPNGLRLGARSPARFLEVLESRDVRVFVPNSDAPRVRDDRQSRREISRRRMINIKEKERTMNTNKLVI